MITEVTRRYVEALTTALADETGITFQDGPAWAANVKDRILKYRYDDLIKLDYLEARGLILHELGHLLYTEPVEASELEKTYRGVHHVYNVFEDIRIESKLCSKYGQFGTEALAASCKLGIIKQTKAYKASEVIPGSLQDILITTLIGYNTQYSRYSGTVGIKPVAILKYPRSMADCLLIEDLTASKAVPITGYNSYTEMRRYIDDKIIPLLLDKLKQEEATPSITTEIKLNDTTGHDRSTGEDTLHKIPIPSDTDLKFLLNPYITTLSNRLTAILRENSCTRFRGAKLSGKLLSKNTHKILAGDSRIFSRRITPDKPKYTISLILDNSGSMCQGNRHPYTYMGAYLITEACKRLGFKINLAKYDGEVSRLESLEDYREGVCGDNRDDLATEWLADQVDPSTNNISILLTDGGVCHDPSSGIDRLTADKHTEYFTIGIGMADDQGLIGEMNRAYPHPIISPTVEAIPNEFIKIINQVIHR